MGHTEFIASMTVSQFRTFKRAVATLRRAGVDYYTAIEIVVNAIQNRDSRGSLPRSVVVKNY